MSGTFTNSAVRTLSLDAIKSILKNFEQQKLPTDWVLASPDGRVWKGRPEQLLQVLIPHHPLLKPPSLHDLVRGGQRPPNCGTGHCSCIECHDPAYRAMVRGEAKP